MKESEIANIVYNFLQQHNYDVYPEAKMRYGKGRADMAAIDGDSFTIVEVKTSLSLRLLEQAHKWIQTRAVNQVYIAIPGRKISNFVKDLCTCKGIGLITVHRPTATAKIEIDAEDQQPINNRKKAMIDSLHPDMKTYTPGTVSGYSTPYNRTMKKVVDYVGSNPGAFISDVVESIEHHYKSKKSATQSIIKAVKSYERGKLIIKKSNRKYKLYPVKKHE